ncbi:4-hydroxybenzoate polyprenyltransferase [Desulfobacula phenolica]|uniref:4-hydroxybenzoate polyprenyltransferase n=2 Tax=Desulfobacula phenolica TaxID=90732 RepID=A0A1H2JW23_9BACT|nr:4-hydroxybenzoate polyprenyltransferase [Desulfobacula phenolica]
MTILLGFKKQIMEYNTSTFQTDLKNYIVLLRPYQWIKNLLLFSPLFFSGNFVNRSLLYITGIGVFVFCLTSGLGYIVNDWIDKENDRFHPIKRHRPFCRGTITGLKAFFLSGCILLIIIICIRLFPFPLEFICYLLAYMILTASYSLYLKQIVILEIFSVAFGFVLRVLAGGAVCNIEISNWLFLTVFFIAMMISIAKRLTELKELGEKNAILHRKSQIGYSLTYLNSMFWTCGSVTLVVYSLYAVEHGSLVIYSVLPASYGIFRFIYLTDLGRGSDPIKTLFSDKQLLLTTLIFLFVLTLVIYWP